MGHMLRGLTETEQKLYQTVGERVDAFCKEQKLKTPDFAVLVGMGVPAHASPRTHDTPGAHCAGL